MDNPGRPGDHTCPHITRSQSPTPIHKHKRTQQVNRWIQAKVKRRYFELIRQGVSGGEGAKPWPGVLTELKNRGVADVLMLVCDGLRGSPRRSTPGGERRSCKRHRR